MTPAASSGTLICRSCEVDAVLVSGDSGREMVKCPACGESGDREEVVRLAGQHRMSGPIEELRDSLARSTAGIKDVKYVRGSRPNLPTPKFVFR